MSLGPLHGLATYPQFLPVMLIPLPNGKTDKIPVSATTGLPVDAQAPANWMPYETASAAAQAMEQATGVRYGVGWVITASTGVFCLDIDGAKQADGSWSALASQLCAMLPGCVIEVSQSGAGLHIWGYRSQIPPHSMKNVEMHLELYSDKRFILLGDQRTGEINRDCTELDSLIATTFPPRSTAGTEHGPGPCPGWNGPADDADLLRRAMQAKSARSVFGRGASFADLWHADTAVLAKAYPTSGEGAYDASSADAALAQHLAFWTGKDAARIERLMRQSNLVRGKWDRPDYIPDTIINACSMQGEVLCDPPIEPGPGPRAPGDGASLPTMTAIEGATFLGPTQQAELFKGCVYVVDLNRVLVPGGSLLKHDQFRAKFGGYTFAMDDKNERTTRNAWEAFTESQVLKAPRADGTCFRPMLPYGKIITDSGRARVNTWWPVEVRAIQGDPSPFTSHVAKLFPVPTDAAIILAYLAFCVQYPGVKAAWAPVLQGVEGNGKTLLSKVLAYCLGERYVHWPKAKKLNGQFNAWMVGKLVYLVEDIYTEKGVDVVEDLKPMIAGGSSLEIEGKGVDQVSAEICGNFILNTNHATGIRKTRNDRRFCWLGCAQQDVDDLARDGMTSDYFARLYGWLNVDGYAIVADYLQTYAIPDELNPATGCTRAPQTSTTAQAIEAGRGLAEQALLEAIDQGAPGFCGGWVSTVMLGRLLEGKKLDRTLTALERAKTLRELGYVLHPALGTKGQVNNPVAPDGAKPSLYVKKGHEALSLSAPSEVARAYAAAQRT